MRFQGAIMWPFVLTLLVVNALNLLVAGIEQSEDVQWKDELREEQEIEAAESDHSLVEFFRNLKHHPKERRSQLWNRQAPEDEKAASPGQDCGTLSLSLVGKMKIVLTSPGYDGSTIYAKNLDCIYVVTAEQGFDIKIDITVIDVEDTPNCKFDYIQIMDSQNTNVVDRICGTSPKSLTVLDNIAKIQFVSDYYFSYTGFSMDITKVVSAGQVSTDCGIPPSVLFADLSYVTTTIGSLAYYTCRTGYKMIGSGTAICTSDGLWGTTPTCEEIFCPKPVINDPYAIPLYTSTRYGSNMTFSCGDKHMLKDPNSYLTCSEDTSWKGVFPECININCGSPPDLSNAILAASTGIYPGDSATYLCADGFLNEGGNKLTCTDTGLWLPYTLDVNCQPIQCPPPPPAPVNGKILFQNGSVFTSQVIYACNEGYYLVNVRGTEYMIECIATGRWDKEPPKCDMSLCGGLIIKTQLSPGGVLTSPNYPDNYSPKRNCTWVIQAPHPGHRITFEIQEMQIEFGENCKYDQLNLYESNGETHSKIGTYCGATTPPTIVTLGNFLIVNLFSDDAETYKGFKANYYFTPARDSNDIQAAAMKYYPDLVQKMLLDTKLDHWVDAIAYIRSYKFTVDGMFDHSDCLYLLEAFDGLFHLIDDHVMPDLEIYLTDTLTRVIYKFNPTNTTLFITLSNLISNNNVTSLITDAYAAIADLKIEVERILGNVSESAINYPATPVVFQAIHNYLHNVIYSQHKAVTALNVGMEIVDLADARVKNLLQIGIWKSPVCPPLVDVIPYLTDAVKTALDRLLLLLHDVVVYQNILNSFGAEATHIADAFHKELTEQLHVLHSPFEVLAIAWNKLKDIELSRLNDTTDIGVPNQGEGQISEAELMIYSTQPPVTDLYKDILEEHLRWNMEEFLAQDIENTIFHIAPELLALAMKDVDEAQIEGMLGELMLQIVQYMPGSCMDAKLTSLVSGIVEVSLLDVIRIDLDITNLTNAMATLALSENLISSSSVQAFAVELAGRYRNELHKIFTVKAHDLEAQLEIITGGRVATETIPMLAIIKATDSTSRTFRELISMMVDIFVHPMRLNVSCPGVDFYGELRPALNNYVESLQGPLVISQLASVTIGSTSFSSGARAYIAEQIKVHYSMVLDRMTGRINRMNLPNHHDLAKQTVIQFILDQMASQLYEAIRLWKPDIPVSGTTTTQGPLPDILPGDLVPLILNMQSNLDTLVLQMMLNMRTLINQMGGGLNACLTYPAMCNFTINYTL